MHRLYFYLAALISIITAPASAIAESVAGPATAAMQISKPVTAANQAGFYITLPAVSSHELSRRIRAHRAALKQREQQLTRYLVENRLDAKDTLITIIMPGGLLYAAVRKGNLEQAKTELREITQDTDELGRDLLAMRAMADKLTVAQLH
jgi:Tfp pilus assembly PilM family ATPase